MNIYYLIEAYKHDISCLHKQLHDKFDLVVSTLKAHKIYTEYKEKQKYTIEYVGIIACSNYALIILPKFFDSSVLDSEIKRTEIKNILMVLKKYSKETVIKNYDYSSTYDEENDAMNRLALIDDLFNDYLEHGLYAKDNTSFEINGNGEIDWQETINEEQSYIINRDPIYLKLHTQDIVSDKNYFIRRLHKYILVQAKEELLKSPILDIIKDFISVPIFDFNINDEGLLNHDFNILSLDKEMRKTHMEQKLLLLKKMKLFLLHKDTNMDQSINFCGINKFSAVWETLCKHVFRSVLNEFQGNIAKPKYYSNTDVIDRSFGTLQPDIITIYNKHLLIIDAKYYNFYFSDNKTIEGNPPVLSDILKQYAYQLAIEQIQRYREQYSDIKNYLCIPAHFSTNNTDVQSKIIGKVNFDIFQHPAIEIIQLNHSKVFTMYLQNKYYENDFYKRLLTNNNSDN